MGSSAPPPPSNQQVLQNTQALASGQKQENIDAQTMNMINQYNPFGSLTFRQTGTGPNGVPMWSSNLQLSPEQQKLFDTLVGTKGMAGSQAQALLGGANYGAAQPADVIGGRTSGITADMMSLWSQANEPAMKTARAQLDASLKNQGHQPGDPAYNNAMRALDTSQTNAIAGASAQFEPLAFQQAATLYGMPWQLASAMAGFGAPGDVKSNLIQTPGMSPVDMNSIYKNQADFLNQQWQAQMGVNSANTQGMWGIPGALAGGWARSGFPGLSSAMGGLGSMFSGLGGAGAAGLTGSALGGAGASAGAEAAMAAGLGFI